ncbi:MAG: hypothetical protein QOE90_3479 [Thermoplasmata archaeon]|nr:hypothetical protein [Thermoplasmata archaeon]
MAWRNTWRAPWIQAWVAVLLALTLALVAPRGALRFAGVAALALFLPGYLLTFLLLPPRGNPFAESDVVIEGKRRGMLPRERAGLGVGFSLTLTTLTGIALTILPGGLSPEKLTTALAGLGLVFGLGALIRTSPQVARVGQAPPSTRAPFSRLEILLVVAAVAGAGIAVVGAAHGLARNVDPLSSEVYFLNAEGNASNFTRTLHPGEALVLMAVTVNHDGKTSEFSARAQLDRGTLNGTAFASDATTPLPGWNVTLDDGASDPHVLNLTAPASPGLYRLTLTVTDAQGADVGTLRYFAQVSPR